ncbi:helix-turn-helix domain-containing protein [Streptomyces odonnellii]|uniref:helix-turn-helix domain-containing protein n=1 Tax=Streptomyces odonnellii TaxID=1417980 RepID=UPI0038CD86EF
MLRELRQARGPTIEKPAEASGVSGRAIGDVERGRRLRTHRGTVVALAQGLRLDEAARAELLTAARPGTRPSGSVKSSSCALPRGVPDFVGRHTELALLHALAKPPSDARRGVPAEHARPGHAAAFGGGGGAAPAGRLGCGRP